MQKLFEVRSDSSSPYLEPKMDFHVIVAQLLYIMKRTRPDLAPAINVSDYYSFKTTKNDWQRIRQSFEYLIGTVNPKLILSVDKSIAPT